MAVQEQARPVDETLRAGKRQQWLERAGKELQVAETWEADRDPERLAAHLDRMVEICTDSDVLTPTDKIDIRDRAQMIKLKTYEQRINFLLELTMTATRDKDRQQERGELFRQINDALNVAVRLGLSDALKQGIKERLEIIQHTSAAGDSTTAKENAERDAGMFETVHPKEHRTFTRWRDPPLVVAISGRSFGTLDWSLGGALLEEVDDDGWKPGQPIDVRIGLSGTKQHTDKMVVVRYIAEHRRLAIKSRRFASVLMQVKRDCDAAGIEPL